MPRRTRIVPFTTGDRVTVKEPLQPECEGIVLETDYDQSIANIQYTTVYENHTRWVHFDYLRPTL